MATRWGIVSAGMVSHDFVTAVRSLPGDEHQLVAVGARSLKSAQEFAERHKILRAYGSYAELAEDPDVEVVYIGTIPSQHFPVAKRMLENGKHVLCETSLALNQKQTKELIALAAKHGRFLMEAIFGRFVPAFKYLNEVLQKNIVGEIKHVYIELGYNMTGMERAGKRSLGGGSIQEFGSHICNTLNMVFKEEKPEKIVSMGHLNDDGVDLSAVISLRYSQNRFAQICTHSMVELDDLIITGTKGKIKVTEWWCPTKIETPNGAVEFSYPDPLLPCNFPNGSGMRYEAMEVRRCLKRGALESAVVPLKYSEAFAALRDEIHSQLGVQYDEDKK